MVNELTDTVIKNQEHRFRFVAGLIVVIFAGLTIQLWILQIMQGATITIQAKRNQTREIKINAPRGNFYDRNKEIIVSSQLSHNISVAPDDMKKQPEVLERLSKILNIPVAELQKRMEPDSKHRYVGCQYVAIAKDIDTQTALKIFENKMYLPGVEVDTVSVRYYPNNEFASHAIGYIREISDRELTELKPKGYKMGDIIGKSGLERTYEAYLRGLDGKKFFEVDIRGRVLKHLGEQKPIPGNSIHLTIDKKLQLAAEKALEDKMLDLQQNSEFKNAKTGAVIALDPRNGDILAMVSKPGIDPNLYVRPISKEMIKTMNDPVLIPGLNRATQAQLAPGSTFKPVTVIAALTEGKATIADRFNCTGYDAVWGARFKCWIASRKTPGPRSHGNQNVVDGLKNSCNMVMSELGRRIGPNVIAKYARLFGLGKRTGLNLYPQEQTALVPDTEWKKKHMKDKTWRPLETSHYSIGQGFLTATPIQLAQLYAALANNGKVYEPRLVTKITSPLGETVKTFKPNLLNEVKSTEENYATLREGLTKVISPGGTGYGAFWDFPLDKYPVAGKTGTAQRPPYDDTGVFCCFAPSNKPEIVVVVLIEQGGSGSGAAAPVARRVLESYFNVQPKVTPTPAVKKSPGNNLPSTTPTPANNNLQGALTPVVTPVAIPINVSGNNEVPVFRTGIPASD